MSLELSFIAPCFNEEDWIPRLLSSLNRCDIDFTKVEFIVVDNCSTDLTVDTVWNIAPSLKYPVRIIHEFRPGVSFARNSGAKAAKGETLIFIDADNRLTPEFVDQVCKLHANPDFCGGTIRTLAEPGNLIGSLVFYCLEAIKMISPKPFGKSVARREAFFQVGGFDPKIKLGENVVFTSKLKRLAKFGSKQFSHIRAPIFCSLRRFDKVGYLRILIPWLIAYLGVRNLPYETYDKL